MVQSELASLRSVHDATAPRVEPSGVPASYARAVSGGNLGYSHNVREVRKKPPNPYTRENQQKRRFNLVIFGVDECPKNTPRLARISQDETSVTECFKKLVPSFLQESIRDCFRLGRYSENSAKPRPILISLTKTSEVELILSKRFSIRPFSY